MSKLPELLPEVQAAYARQLAELGPATITRSMAIARLAVSHLILLGVDPGEVRAFVEHSIRHAEAKREAARRAKRLHLKIVPPGET